MEARLQDFGVRFDDGLSAVAQFTKAMMDSGQKGPVGAPVGVQGKRMLEDVAERAA